MKTIFKIFLLAFLTGPSLSCFSQASDPGRLKPDPKKESMYLPYLAVRHGGPVQLAEWKKSNVLQYYKELWYYTESFYVKKDHLSQGVALNEEIIDISRYESSRKEHGEAIVILPGFKDALVLLPADQLIYKP